jgi:hypothetical protein
MCTNGNIFVKKVFIKALHSPIFLRRIINELHFYAGVSAKNLAHKVKCTAPEEAVLLLQCLATL